MRFTNCCSKLELFFLILITLHYTNNEVVDRILDFKLESTLCYLFILFGFCRFACTHYINSGFFFFEHKCHKYVRLSSGPRYMVRPRTCDAVNTKYSKNKCNLPPELSLVVSREPISICEVYGFVVSYRLRSVVKTITADLKAA